MTTLLRMCVVTTTAFISIVSASSPSLGEVAGRWQIREPSGSTFLQFVHEEGDVLLTLYCSKKGSNRVEVTTPVGSDLVKAGQKAPLTLDWESSISVTMDAKLDTTSEDPQLKGYVGLRDASLVLAKAESGMLAIKVRGVEQLLPVKTFRPLWDRFVVRCS
jgi:hypothetical protein